MMPVEYKLEDTIVEAFRHTMPVVALGKPGETFGIGRILVDEESWQRSASELMHRASLLMSAFRAARLAVGDGPNHTQLPL
jgi:hypothetical protein